MSIKERTVKMVLATLLSIYVANAFQLEHALAAGIIAILSLLDTKRASFITAFKRLMSTIAAFTIASVIFYFLGFTVTAFGLYLIIYIPVAYRYDLQSGIAPCSVLVTHFIGAGSISWMWQINGFLLMFIGAAGALLFNLWMPSYKSELEKNKEKFEDLLRTILKGISLRLTSEKLDYSITKKVREAEELLLKTKSKALAEYDNQLFDKDDYNIRYLQMREKQLTLVKKMIQFLENIDLGTTQSNILADLFRETSDQLNEKNTGVNLLNNISRLYKQFRQSTLPRSREEFENRAYLFQLLHDIEELIDIKRAFFVKEESILNTNKKTS